MSKMINPASTGDNKFAYREIRQWVVEVFRILADLRRRSPRSWAFGRTELLGDQARTYAEKDPKSVATRFKQEDGDTGDD